jgi:eukaryotic-like serine/threonine-protein kinase
MKRFTLVSIILMSSFLLSACAGARGASWPGLAVDASTAYLASNQFIYAVRLRDGIKTWQFPLQGGSQAFDANPVVTPDGQLLVASAGTDRGLYSLDLATGSQKWSFTAATDRWIAPPLVVKDTIYAPNTDGVLYALKLSTGEKSWSLPISSSIWGSPVTDGKLIFVVSLDHFLYAVDPQSQKIVWKVDLGGAVPAAPLISTDGTTLFTGSSARKFFAIDTTAGSIRWTADTKDWVWNTPAVSGDSVFAADISGNVYSFGVVNGKNPWPVVQPDGPITGSPLVQSSGVLVATESGSLFALDPQGVKLWELPLAGNIYTTPAASGSLILVSPLNTDFLLAAVIANNHSLVWKFTGK